MALSDPIVPEGRALVPEGRTLARPDAETGRRMPWFEVNDTETESAEIQPIAEAILSHA